MGKAKTIFDLDLVAIARWHKRCTVLAVLMVGAFFASIVVSSGVVPFPSQGVADGVIAVSTVVWLLGTLVSVVFVVMMQLAMGRGVGSVVVYALLALVLSWLVLLASVSAAGVVLRLAGVELGFLGVAAHEVEKLRPGHCRGCGYLREGIGVLDPCPECERVPQVI